MKTWIDRVQNVYSSVEELESYNRIYGICRRCGYKTVKGMWRANRIIGGSVHPEDSGWATKRDIERLGLDDRKGVQN